LGKSRLLAVEYAVTICVVREWIAVELEFLEVVQAVLIGIERLLAESGP
jgi:hypothetical protein